MDGIEAILNKDLYQVVTRVAEWATDLLREYLQTRIYDWGEEQKERAFRESGQYPIYADGSGHPTGDLMRSITMDEVVGGAIANYVGYTIFSDPQKMSLNHDHYIHSDGQTDYRAVLLERLNDALGDYPGEVRDQWWTSNDPYGHFHFFDDYIRDLDANIYSQFEKEMTKIGWAWQREGYVPDVFDSI